MIIAIDFDETYTRDPILWGRFVIDAKNRGHKVICVTARYDDGRHGDNMDIWDTIGKILPKSDIYFSGIAAKQDYMVNEHDIFPHVWIDDCPIGIVE